MSLFRRKPAPVTIDADFGSWGSAPRDPVEGPVHGPAGEAGETTAPTKRVNARNNAEHSIAAKRAMAAAKKQRDDDSSADPSATVTPPPCG